MLSILMLASKNLEGSQSGTRLHAHLVLALAFIYVVPDAGAGFDVLVEFRVA